MFEQLNVSRDVFSGGDATENGTPFQIPRPDVGTLCFVVTTEGRTAGTFQIVLQSSDSEDGTYRIQNAASQVTVNADGVTYLYCQFPYASWLRIAGTRAGGFDGTVTVELRAGNWLQADEE